jgi:3-isopropylmalate dehydrogenase
MLAIAVIPGDGIGNEVVPEALKVLKTLAEVTGMDLRYETFDYGAERYLRTGEGLPDNFEKVIKDIANNFDAILFGAGGTDSRVPRGVTYPAIAGFIRRTLDLYANLRPCKLYDARLTPLKGKTEADINFVVFRECTEGLPSGLGGNFKKGTPDEIAIQEEIHTWKGVHRVIKYAFEYAKNNNLTRVTMAEKGPGKESFWLRVFRELAKNYPEIEAEDIHIDTMCYQMVMKPEHFQVIVTENRWGDISSDLGAALQGGRGLSPSGVFSAEKNICYFEPIHGTAPDIFGKNLANPFATILAAKMLLEHFDFQEQADIIERAVVTAIKEGKTTSDIGGNLGTTEVGDFVCQTIQQMAG